MGCGPSNSNTKTQETLQVLPPIKTKTVKKGSSKLENDQKSIAYEIPVEKKGGKLPPLKLDKPQRDSQTLRQKLLLKEQKAQERRDDQLLKFREKMAKRDENSKRVVERKKNKIDEERLSTGEDSDHEDGHDRKPSKAAKHQKPWSIKK